jgi:PRTRC genetic system protein C
MALILEAIERTFRYNGMDLPDPNPSLSVSEVQGIHSGTYPELATAKPTVEQKNTANGTRQVITYAVAAGTKG